MYIPKKKRNKRLAVFCGCVLAALLCFLIIPQLAPGENISFDTEEVRQLDQWSRLLPDGSSVPISLPAKVAAGAGEPLKIVSVLPEQRMPGAVICMRTSLQSIRIESGDELLYERGCDPAQYRASLVGSAWNIVRLPEDVAGQEITITLVSPQAGTAGTVNEVLYGSKSALLFYLIDQYAGNLISAVLVFLTGVLLLVLSLLLRDGPVQESELFYLSLFAILVSFWLAGECKMLQFFTGSHYLVSNLAFVSLLLLPIPFVLYIERAYQPHGKRLTPMMFWTFCANFVICMTLQLLGIANLFETLHSLHLLILLFMLLVVASLLREAIRWHSKDAARLLLAQAVLFVSSFVEIGDFYRGKFASLSGTLRIGLMFYIVLLAIDSIHKLGTLFEKNREAQYLRSLAYRDLLTGGRNRTAYYEDVKQCFDGAPGRQAWLVLFALNNLKEINDGFGHARGDEALKKAYECIVVAFADAAHCYRIGGDEFAAIVPNANEGIFEQAIQMFQRTVEQQAKNLPYGFSIAMGFGWYDPALYSGFDALAQEVDRRMYANKLNLKNKQSGADSARLPCEGGNGYE